jgi:hypothetical protein
MIVIGTIQLAHHCDQFKSNQIKPNQNKSKQIKTNQNKSKQIKTQNQVNKIHIHCMCLFIFS